MNGETDFIIEPVFHFNGETDFIIEPVFHFQLSCPGFTLLYIIIYTIYAIHFFMFIFPNINSFGTSAKYKETNSWSYYKNNLTIYLANKYRHYSLF